MDNEQLLQAISEMMDEKLKMQLQPIKERLDVIDTRLDKMESRLDKMEVIQRRTVKKLDDLQLDVKTAERNLKRDIHDLEDEMETGIEVLRRNEILPR